MLKTVIIGHFLVSFLVDKYGKLNPVIVSIRQNVSNYEGIASRPLIEGRPTRINGYPIPQTQLVVIVEQLGNQLTQIRRKSSLVNEVRT